MSTSGTIFTGYQNHTRFYLSWQLAGQEIANNRSLINWQIGIQGQAGFTAFWYSNAIRVNSGDIDGGGSLGSGTWSNKTLAGTQSIQLLSGSKWVGHNSDGTKSFGANVSGWLFQNSTVTASGSWAITTIPRNSQVTTNAASYDLGSPIVINTNRKSASFTHTVTIRLNNSGGTILRQANSITDSFTWTPSAGEITSMQNAIPSTNALNIYIDSYNNQVGASSAVSVVNNLKLADPTFTTFTYKDTSAATVTITGSDQVLVKGKSTLQLQVASTDKMVAIKGATADHYDFQYDGTINPVAYSTSTITSDFTPIASTGERTMIVRAYDSRNNSVSASQGLTVYDYSAPTILTTLTRENNFGANTTIAISGTYNNLTIAGVKKSSLTTGTMQYRYKETGGAFGSWVTRTFTFDDALGTFDNASFVVSLDNKKKYEFEFKIADAFGTVTTTNIVDIGVPIMFVGENSGVGAIGINKMPENGALDVSGNIIANNFYPIGSVYINASDSTNPATLLGFGTWAAWGVGKAIVGIDTSQTEFDTAEETGGDKTHNHDQGDLTAKVSFFASSSNGYIDYTLADVPGGNYTENRRLRTGSGGAVAESRTETNTNDGVDVYGTTGNTSSLSPYQVGYVWKRTA